jgi:hypothetical protein
VPNLSSQAVASSFPVALKATERTCLGWSRAAISWPLRASQTCAERSVPVARRPIGPNAAHLTHPSCVSLATMLREARSRIRTTLPGSWRMPTSRLSGLARFQESVAAASRDRSSSVRDAPALFPLATFHTSARGVMPWKPFSSAVTRYLPSRLNARKPTSLSDRRNRSVISGSRFQSSTAPPAALQRYLPDGWKAAAATNSPGPPAHARIRACRARSPRRNPT